ncbi:hypothetical protein DFJ58DRAFT_742727 [Suillus subalutaceus]|uniref:uncharacterized protein n=1 Tax=Suillus subalutaceus TaxID=48586 RepID=UPI001B876CAE|nr:uncharacterized protein DFJ58DRAFT_742727 [Suillus subalutaceus]KAG1868378.1 hypothetical protein DFJ58DRAFT_742727 [Suillus subalutaceus]
MTTKSPIHDDIATTQPPSYDAISKSPPAHSVHCKPPVFSSLQSEEQRRTTVLSHIREIVSSPHFTPSSVAKSINYCAAALPSAEFSDLLQENNILGHNAIYWAILDFGDDTFHKRWERDKVDAPLLEDKSFRRFLGCPPDDIQVHEGDGLGEHQFVACFRFRMFQKRLRITPTLSVEFIAAGRSWVLWFNLALDGIWRVTYRLAEDSFPADAAAVFLIEAHRGPPGCATGPAPLIIRMNQSPTCTLLPPGPLKYSTTKPGTDSEFRPQHYTDIQPGAKVGTVCRLLGEWLMDNNTIYVDSDGTLHAQLKITVKSPTPQASRQYSGIDISKVDT